MRARLPSFLVSVVIVALAGAAACGPKSSGQADDIVDDGDGGGSNVDAPFAIDAPTDAVDDAATAYPDAAPFDGNPQCNDWMCTTPVNDGCSIGTSDACGDGLDNNCNGQVDEGCTCTAGAVQQCFLGPPGRRAQGACVEIGRAHV